MKAILSVLIFIFLTNLSTGQMTSIPDPNFEQALIDLGLDFGTPNGYVATANIDTIGVLDVSYKNISSLNGLEDFSNLWFLKCSFNQLTSLNISQNSNLTNLSCESNLLTNLNLAQNIALEGIAFGWNQVSSLNVTNNLNLQHISCENNILTSIDISQNPLLRNLWCDGNQLTNVDVTQNPNLEWFKCRNNLITNINFSVNTGLVILDCTGNQLNNLNLQDTSLSILECSYNNFSNLVASQYPNLNILKCYYNQLTELDLSQNFWLQQLNCNDNRLTCLNVKNGNNTFIQTMSGSNFSAENNPNLTCIEVDNASWSLANWILIDPQTSFNTNCNNPCIVGTEENSQNNLSFYPNPTAKLVNIEFESIKPNLTVTLTNSVGQIVSTKKYKSTDFINLNIDTPSGIYFLQLKIENEMITRKVIKE